MAVSMTFTKHSHPYTHTRLGQYPSAVVLTFTCGRSSSELLTSSGCFFGSGSFGSGFAAFECFFDTPTLLPAAARFFEPFGRKMPDRDFQKDFFGFRTVLEPSCRGFTRIELDSAERVLGSALSDFSTFSFRGFCLEEEEARWVVGSFEGRTRAEVRVVFWH